MLNLNNVYNHYSSNLVVPKRNSKYDSHKKDDLKTIYHKMVKDTQNSPFYKFTLSDMTQAYTIGIKETALALEANSKSLSNQTDNSKEDLIAVSDNEDVVFANLSTEHPESLPEDIAIQVNSLATGQTNIGTFLPSNDMSFNPGDYSLGIAVGNNHYTFNLTISNQDNNLKIQRDLAKSINDNHIGIQANIRKNIPEQTSALVLRSKSVGLVGNKDTIFEFDESYLENDISSQLGIEHIDTLPSNAEFYINEKPHSSSSNHISLNHSIDIDLLATSEEPISIQLLPDEKKIANKLNNFLDSYNQLIDLAKTGTAERGSSRLFHEVSNITKRNLETLHASGLHIDENDHLILKEEPDSNQIRSLFNDELSSFRKDIERTTEKMTLNPLNYIDKVIVTYPNTSGTYPNPYQPSKYSGLLYNDYA